MCRHTTGLNQYAIGIEHVGGRTRTCWQPGPAPGFAGADRVAGCTFPHPLANVIGHNESLDHPLRQERYAAWRCQTHADFTTGGDGRLPEETEGAAAFEPASARTRALDRLAVSLGDGLENVGASDRLIASVPCRGTPG